MPGPLVPLLGLAAAGGLVRLVLKVLTLGIVSYTAALAMVELVSTMMQNAVLGSLGGVAASIIGLARLDEAISIGMMFVNIRLGIAGLKRFKLL